MKAERFQAASVNCTIILARAQVLTPQNGSAPSERPGIGEFFDQRQGICRAHRHVRCRMLQDVSCRMPRSPRNRATCGADNLMNGRGIQAPLR